MSKENLIGTWSLVALVLAGGILMLDKRSMRLDERRQKLDARAYQLDLQTIELRHACPKAKE